MKQSRKCAASAASLAGAKKLVAAGIVKPTDRVVGVLTGNMLKDPMYSLAYHESTLTTHDVDASFDQVGCYLCGSGFLGHRVFL